MGRWIASKHIYPRREVRAERSRHKNSPITQQFLFLCPNFTPPPHRASCPVGVGHTALLLSRLLLAPTKAKSRPSASQGPGDTSSKAGKERVGSKMSGDQGQGLSHEQEDCYLKYSQRKEEPFCLSEALNQAWPQESWRVPGTCVALCAAGTHPAGKLWLRVDITAGFSTLTTFPASSFTEAASVPEPWVLQKSMLQ